MKIWLPVFFLVTLSAFAQKTSVNPYTSVDTKALQIPDSLTTTPDGIAEYINLNFKTDKERVRAIFIWIATNIEYDFDNLFAINLYEKEEDKILLPLKTRKGICENYAALFCHLCTKTGIRSYRISGYTKQNGFVDYIPHSWAAALIENNWYLFDPTWGSGYVSNDKFYKRIDNTYFYVTPSVLIKSHIPFDPLWQFLNYPITNQEFYEGKITANTSKPLFNYSDSIQVYEKQGIIEQLQATAYRIQKNGVKNAMIVNMIHYLKGEVENEKGQIYNKAGADFNEAVKNYNVFINYRNKQFNPPKADIEIKVMLDTTEASLQEAKYKLNTINSPNVELQNLINLLNKQITELADQTKEQQNWLQDYFRKGKLGRRLHFSMGK
ncbi:transglutaminase domain-containing protein [Cytophagaceae bacterium YF14B1]|uniref:Transglutaminase domain-containing protein n=1 Tax=Xanthocytophaga flava TaxID=3048013 RepID=A0AAE3QSA7_9BACT|nr:transglutaminase domain-containing protein [Xanthocytophaga flavus]MDJ1481944.1 transglutaminase domain-containing protein [Xanthocytophaga flavus]